MPDPSNLHHTIKFTDHSHGGITEHVDLTSNSTRWGMGGSQPLFPSWHSSSPHKTTQKILDGKYIDMAHLHPDTWRMEEVCMQSSATPSFHPRKKPVTEILV